MATKTAKPLLGELAAARCAECRACKDAHYVDPVTGWFTDDDGQRHNHIGRSKEAARRHLREAQLLQRVPVYARTASTAKPASALTPEEVWVAQQMGVSLELVAAQKARDLERG